MDRQRALTWAGLLGQWVQFAQTAVALPEGAEGDRWKAAVADLIGLSALTMALDESGHLPDAEKALAKDRAKVLLDRHRDNLRSIFGLDGMHPMVRQMINDAEAAWEHLVAALPHDYDAES